MDVILPLMLTCILSTLLSSHFHKESIYSIKLLKKKIHLIQGGERNLLRSLFVRDLLPTKVEGIGEGANFAQVAGCLINQPSPYLPLLDGEGVLRGMISLHDIKGYLLEGDLLTDLVIARDIAVPNPQWATPGMSLDEALRRMEEEDLLGLPLVKDREKQTYIGMIWQKDILDAYQQEIRRRDMAHDLADQLYGNQSRKKVEVQGMELVEVEVPGSF